MIVFGCFSELDVIEPAVAIGGGSTMSVLQDQSMVETALKNKSRKGKRDRAVEQKMMESQSVQRYTPAVVNFWEK